MKTLLKYVLGSLATLAVMAAGLLLYVLFGNLSVHQDRILAAASNATGFDITAEGPFDLEVGKKITLSANQVTVANPDWPDDASLATLGEIEVVVDTWSVFSGPLEIDTLALGDTDLNLKERDEGRANWLVSKEPEEEPPHAPRSADPILHSVVLSNVRFSHQPDEAGSSQGNAVVLQLDRTGANQYDFGLEAGVGQAESNIALTGSGALRFSDSLSSFSGLRIDFDEAELEATGPVTASATLTGFTTIDLSGEKPAIELAMEVSTLTVPPGSESDEETSDESNGNAEFLFDSDELAYSWLDALSLDADMKITQASVGGNNLNDVHVVTRIADSSLTVAPFELKLGEGTLSGTLTLGRDNDLYALDISAEADNLRFTQLAREGQQHTSLPPLNATLKLAGTGASMHDIMASANGRMVGRQESGQLDLQAINALFSDFLTSILRTLNPLAEEQPYANIECGIYEIDIVEGVATIEEAAIQSDRITIVSSGKIDLGTEEIDMVLRTKSREGLGISVGGVANSFVKLGGTLKEPALGFDAAGSVTTTGAAVATGGLSLLAKSLWDRVSSEIDLCSKEEQSQ